MPSSAAAVASDVRCWVRRDGEELRTGLAPAEIAQALADEGALVWVDIEAGGRATGGVKRARRSCGTCSTSTSSPSTTATTR